MGEKITVYVRLNVVLVSWTRSAQISEIIATTAEQPRSAGQINAVSENSGIYNNSYLIVIIKYKIYIFNIILLALLVIIVKQNRQNIYS